MHFLKLQLKMSTFTKLGVATSYIKALNEISIKTPTEIQEKVIPLLLNSETDFIGLAQTGTGKTAAYGIPVLQKIDTESSKIQALILSPTRELVKQIKKQLFKFTKYNDKKLFVEAIYGGEKIEKQLKSLQRTTHVVVATPGRLMDFIERGEIDLKHISVLVLDESDEMLSMGFKQDLNRILKYTGKTKNTWLFSATFPEDVKKITKTYMSVNAPKVVIDENTLVNANISHEYIKTTVNNKLNVIIRFLENRSEERGIIFCRTKAGVQKLARLLQEEGFSVAALEGDMQQKERDKVMRMFKNQSLQVLIATDVAARGIDVSNLAFVLHHQLPEKDEYYTHRSGRTARAGKEGVSVALVSAQEQQRIQELQNKLKIRFKEVY